MIRIVNKKKRLYLVFIATMLVLASFPALFAAVTVPVAEFDIEDLNTWGSHNFNKKTEYSRIKLDNRWVLRASSNDSSSMLIKKKRVDLLQTPYLNWQWRVDSGISGIDEHTTRGDDFAARVNIIVDGGFLFWDTLTLNYVWSSNQAVGTEWSNPFSNNAQMIALESGVKHQKEWMTERRNVYQDLKRVFGREIRYIDAVAVMTDSDNSDSQALAYYGNIYFSSQ